MENQQNDIQSELDKARNDLLRDLAVKGCCTITFAGHNYKSSGISQRECARIAGNYPGATYNFQPGQDCD